jgi:hypothetical protein
MSEAPNYGKINLDFLTLRDEHDHFELNNATETKYQ